MKKVKLKATLKDKVTVEIIELCFDDNDLEMLRLFSENYNRLLSAQLIKNGLPSITKMGWNAKTGSKFEFTDFKNQDVFELLHLSRPFFLYKEPASFDKICAVFGKRGKGTSLTGHLKNIRSLYENGEYLPFFQIEIDNIPLFNNDTLKVWLNGIEYHQDKEKKEIYRKLEKALGSDTARAIFVSQLSGRIKAIHMLAYLVNPITA
ncbi:MAG: hypothetical protein JW927_22500 [Deltaproteobacteria bacterium]|nr:hypothetical protein [Deltaproteobacteria bacterium]